MRKLALIAFVISFLVFLAIVLEIIGIRLTFLDGDTMRIVILFLPLLGVLLGIISLCLKPEKLDRIFAILAIILGSAYPLYLLRAFSGCCVGP